MTDKGRGESYEPRDAFSELGRGMSFMFMREWWERGLVLSCGEDK